MRPYRQFRSIEHLERCPSHLTYVFTGAKEHLLAAVTDRSETVLVMSHVVEIA